MREGVYLEKMAEFAALLRHEGLTVGLRETEDMCRILSELDLADRGTVYAVLSSLCAKSREEQAVFRRAFDGFFVSAEQRQALRARHEAEARELAQRRAEAERDLQAGGNPIPLREDLQEVYVRMGEDKREQLRQMLEKTQGNLERNPKLYGNFIRSVFMRFLLEQQMAMEDAAVGSESLDPDLALLYRDISQFRETDIPRAAALVSAIARQLDAELSRARRGGGHSGKLDFKRTIRRGLETGGTFYRLSYRPRRQKRRRLVLLCDVSGSMLQFSEFALRFLKSMSEVSESSKTFLFSEELCRPGTGIGGPLRPAPRRPGPLGDAAHPLRHQDHRRAPGRTGPAGGPQAGGQGPLAQPHPPEEVALRPQHPDHVHALPNGRVQYPGGALQHLPEDLAGVNVENGSPLTSRSPSCQQPPPVVYCKGYEKQAVCRQ